MNSTLQKYLDRLSPLEQKMQFDDEGLYSLTPQEVGETIAKRISGKLVIDAFCGVGGIAIALARAGKKVIAVDLNLRRLAMARYNAELFGVEGQIEFRNQDFLRMGERPADAVFLDPPWGGPDYSKLEKFWLSNFSPGGKFVLEKAFAVAREVAFNLPKNFEISELDRFGRSYTLEENYLKEKLIHRTAYFP